MAWLTRAFSGVSADGLVIDVHMVTKKAASPEARQQAASPEPEPEPEPAPEPKPEPEMGMRIKRGISPKAVTVPVLEPKEASVAVSQAEAEKAAASEPTPISATLLSRIGGPALRSVNGKTANTPIKPKGPSYLEPFGQLLLQAGIKDIDHLRKLVRKSTVAEYAELLIREYGQQPEFAELGLQGATGRWALRERLEEWLGVKVKGQGLDWGERPPKLVNGRKGSGSA